MNVAELTRVLLARRQLARRERWSRDTLLAYQTRALRDLRQFAVARSPLYRELYRGLEDAPLEALPVLDKATVMDRFDDLVTDRDVRLAGVETHLKQAAATDLFRDRYRVAATGGTTGRRGVFLSDPAEWRAVLASYSRAYAWAGVEAGPAHRLRMAVVSSRNPSHQSSIVGATVASRFLPTLRLDASDPLETIVRSLNEFRPEALVGYASMLRILANEQLDGRLSITPQGVISASEVLTDETRQRVHAAFGVPATNVYAATETAGIASECRHGHMHRYEDLVIAEIVDDENRPVREGDYGSKLLVTVLLSRTQPLIRYELSDRVAAASGGCPDRLPFSMLSGIEGREEDILVLRGITVHPHAFHSALETLPVAGWQVIDESDGLRVLLAGGPPGIAPAAVVRAVQSALAGVGVPDYPVAVDLVGSIPRTSLGKVLLVRRGARA